MLLQLLSDESGMIISAELVLVLTIAVLAMVVGLIEVAKASITELNDISNAIGAFNQTFGFTGYHGAVARRKGLISFFDRTTFIDSVDDCDTNTSCEIVVGASLVATIE